MDQVYVKLSEDLSKQLFELNKEINSMYEKRDSLVKEIFERNKRSSEGTFKIDTDDKPFKRIRVIDNLDKIVSGETLYKSAGFSRYSVEISDLKNEPKSEVIEVSENVMAVKKDVESELSKKVNTKVKRKVKILNKY